jgi:peptide/nickel transport system substrate-binding protein
MSSKDYRRIDAIRRTQGTIGNHVIDEFVAGRLSRRGLIRRGTIVGLSMPAIGALIAACGDDKTTTGTTGGGADTTVAGTTGDSTATTGAPTKGGIFRAGSIAPSSASATLDPVLINDGAGLSLLSQVGQFLTLSNADLSLSPSIATEWAPNADASEWTFTLNPAVKFSDGSPLTAADVVASIERLIDPANNSNALSAFSTGKLAPGGCTAVDDGTVKFTLTGPMSNFPYILSSDNYNAIILPKSVTDTSNFAADVMAGKIATSGAWTISKYDATSGVSFAPNPNYWGDAVLLDGVDYVFFTDESSGVAAFLSGEIDGVVNFNVSGGEALFDNPDITVFEIPSANHRQIHMRCSEGKFADKRIRQAMAMAVDRQSIIDSLFTGKASIANDTPFFDLYPSSGTRVEPTLDLEKAKQLVADAGGGFDDTLYGITFVEAPDLAVLLQNAAKSIGINLTIELRDDYYDKNWVRTYDPSVPGSDIGITDYGHRGVPDVYLNAALRTFKSVDDGAGVWNAAEFANADYDAAVDAYSSSADLQSQKAAAEKIQAVLADEVPMLIPYNINYLSATSSKVSGVVPTAMGHYFTDKASKG